MTGGVRVLCVDSDRTSAETLSDGLTEQGGFAVEAATSVRAALAVLEKRHAEVDCVVSEYDLHDDDGIALLRAVREHYGPLPFVLFTDAGSEAVASEAIAAGVTDYLPRGGAGETEAQYGALADRVRRAVGQAATGNGIDHGRYVCGGSAPAPAEFLHAVEAPLFAFDHEGRFTLLNEALCEVVAVDPEDLLGEHFSAVTAAADVDRATGAFETVADPATDAATATFEQRVRTGDGEWIPVETSIARLPGEKSRGVAGTLRDISGQKRRLGQLRMQKQRLDEVASFVSHDMRTPLTALDGYLSLAADTGEAEYVEKARETVDRLAAMADGITDLARQGWGVEDTEPVALGGLVTETWQYVDSRGATLHNEVPDDCRVEADRDKLAHLLENLLGNAVEHGSTSPASDGRQDADDAGAPTVRVGVTEEGFYVADDGPGIPEDERDAVTETGYTTGEGTGLGLALVQRVVDAHDWTLDIEESDAGGARFVVRTHSSDRDHRVAGDRSA